MFLTSLSLRKQWDHHYQMSQQASVTLTLSWKNQTKKKKAQAVCKGVRKSASWWLEVAKSGLKGGLQSSTPWFWVAFDVARRLWWPQPRRNAARPPSSLTKPPELWNAAQAASPAGMGLEHRQPIAPRIPSLTPLPGSVDNMAAISKRHKIWGETFQKQENIQNSVNSLIWLSS